MYTSGSKNYDTSGAKILIPQDHLKEGTSIGMHNLVYLDCQDNLYQS